MRPLADYHTHTRWSHGKGTIADNLRAGEALGLEALGIAEHGPRLLLWGVPRRRWPVLAQAVRTASQGPTRLLFNIEANVISLAGDLDLPPGPSPDMVLVGLHPQVAPQGLAAWWTYYGLRWLSLLSPACRHRLYDAFTLALVRAVERHRVDVVVHPGYRLPVDTAYLARVCARRGTRLEINCRHLEAAAPDILRAARDSEVEFVFGSDAHRPEEIGRFEKGRDFVRRWGIEGERIINVDWQEKGS